VSAEIRPAASVRKFPIDGGLVLFDVRSTCLFAYNDTARHVWELIEAGRKAADLESAFAQAWEIPLSRARADVQSIVAQWRLKGLLDGGENRSAQVEPVEGVASEGHRVAPTESVSEWTCTIRRIPVAFAIDKKLAAPIRRMLEHLETPGALPQARIELRCGQSGEAVLRRDGRERGRTKDPAEIVGGLWQTILECLHPNMRWRAVLHGAAVAREGAGLALSASSGSGKTTLAAALITGGFAYLADDIVAVAEPDGRIVPCPLPLSIKPGSVDVLKAAHPQLAQARRYRTKGLKARLLLPAVDVWDTDPVELKVLIFPRFIEGAAPDMRKLSSFEALERLLADRVWLGYPITEPRVATFLAWLENVSAYAISYGTLNDGVHLVERVMT
jgi:hypothetical protein